MANSTHDGETSLSLNIIIKHAIKLPSHCLVQCVLKLKGSRIKSLLGKLRAVNNCCSANINWFACFQVYCNFQHVNIAGSAALSEHLSY
jgi:hypothetical protein